MKLDNNNEFNAIINVPVSLLGSKRCIVMLMHRFVTVNRYAYDRVIRNKLSDMLTVNMCDMFNMSPR